MDSHDDKIAKAASVLDALAPKATTPKGAMAVVDALYDKISAAIDKGYNYEEIAKLIGETGVKISASTLRQYYTQRKSGTKKRTPRKRKISPENQTV
ncbi:hypothetical protein D3C71_1633350 [compost metagenome]